MRLRAVCHGGLLLASVWALGGCDKLKEIDDIKNGLAAAQKQAAATQKQVSEIQIELARMRDKLSALDATNVKNKAEASGSALTRTQIAALTDAIAKCVQAVRSAAPADFNGQFYREFDAFYNPATGLVQNNVIYNGSRAALYEFNKCMSSRGIPLG